MTDRNFVLICGAAGTDLGVCAQRIREYVNPSDGRRTNQESSISLVEAKEYIRDPVDYNRRLTYQVLMTRPRPQIFSVWNLAIRDAIISIDYESHLRAVATHLTVFDVRTKVFHSPAYASSFCVETPTDGGPVISSKPSRIVLLIDDIYDMLRRLAGPGEIYPASKRASDTLDNLNSQIKRAYGTSRSFKELRETEKALSSLDAQVGALKHLLYWRRAEMIAAENLSAQLGVPLTVIGTKHPLAIADLLLRPPDESPVTYISHPITRHRFARGQPGVDHWDDDVHNLNQLPAVLASYGVISVMPTAIDELRFGPPLKEDLFARNSSLRHRWPLMRGELLGYRWLGADRFDPAPSDIDIDESLFVESAQAASSYLRTLEALVYDEIPFRDHYLVNHCPGLVVFRPRADGESFSGGVQQEITFFERLADAEPLRRMIVIHDRADVMPILNGISIENDETQADLIEAASRYVRQNMEAYLSTPDIPGYARRVAFRGTLPESQLAQLGTTRERIKMLQKESWVAAACHVVYKELTGLQGLVASCRIIVTNTSGTDFVPETAQWLRSIDPAPKAQDAQVYDVVGERTLLDRVVNDLAGACGVVLGD